MGWTEFRLRLLQPEAHVHLAVHRRRRREMLLCLRLLPGAPVELPEAEVAVGLERAHTHLLGRRERLTIVGLGTLGLGRIAIHHDLAKKSEGLGEASVLSS